MNEYEAFEGIYLGERAIWLRSHRFEAALLPEIGGNLIAFRDRVTGSRFLHEPTEEEMPSFKERPMIHGIPVLFPPNRYEDGKFPWGGNVIDLPVNEPATGNHLHGFLYNTPWQVDDFGTTATESYVVVSIRVDRLHPVYVQFPFVFSFKIRYALSSNGLSQHVVIRNDDDADMPCLLAFHTSLNAPFAPDGAAADYRMKMTIGKRWELNDRMLPTSRFQSLGPNEELMKGEGVYPFFESMDNHYTAIPQNGRNKLELMDTRTGMTLVYDVGTSYKQWMIWNNAAQEGFFCPEPQVNLVNAPHSALPAEEIGLFSLAPGEIWEETSRLYVIRRVETKLG